MKTRSTHACGKLVTSLKFDADNPATVTSGVYSTPRWPVATYISLVVGLMVTELMSIEIAPLKSVYRFIFVHDTPRLVVRYRSPRSFPVPLQPLLTATYHVFCV